LQPGSAGLFICGSSCVALVCSIGDIAWQALLLPQRTLTIANDRVPAIVRRIAREPFAAGRSRATSLKTIRNSACKKLDAVAAQKNVRTTNYLDG